MNFGFEIEKMNGQVRFEFETVGINEYNELKLKYRCEQFKEQPQMEKNDGWFFNGKYNVAKKAVTFTPNTVMGHKVDGVSLTDEIIRELEIQKRKFTVERNAEIERIKAYCPTKIRWAIGGDTHQLYISTNEIDTRLAKPDTFADIEATLETMNKKELAEMSTELDISTGLYTMSGWYEIKVSTIASLVESKRSERQAKEVEQAQMKASRDTAKVKMAVTILSKKVEGDDDDVTAQVKIVDNETGESAIFVCRNIFDFGYVVNPKDGGVLINGEWDMFDEPSRPASDFEKRAVGYLNKFPPIADSIRM